MTMTKRELVMRVANELGITQSDVAKVIETTFQTIAKGLAKGERWELRDFGVFEVKTRASRIGRNPRTGDQVPVPERRVVAFRPGKRMKERISNPDGTVSSAADQPEESEFESGETSNPSADHETRHEIGHENRENRRERKDYHF